MLDHQPLRARYDLHGTAYEADGRPVTPDQLRLRTFNFGQFWRTEGIEIVSYAVVLPAAFFHEMLAAELPDYIKDARAFPAPDDPFDQALAAKGWPEVDAVLAEPALTLLALNVYAHELLFAWLGDGEPTTTPGYVLNTIDQVSLEDDGRTRIEGRARRAGQAVRYQDR